MRADRLSIPESLSAQLLTFRRHLWTVKLIEAIAGAAFVFGLAYLATFVLDRFVDTPALVRTGFLAVAVAAGATIPWAWHRWVWRRRAPEQLARLLTRKHASIGDQLLGVIELAHSDSEQARSRALCEAAIAQVAQQAQGRDFRDAVPNPRHRGRAIAALGTLAGVVALLVLQTPAALNAWARFLRPWHDTPRYTFAKVGPLPAQLVVAYGEPFSLRVKLQNDTVWSPATAELRLPGHPPLVAQLKDGGYQFDLHGQVEEIPLQVRVGDWAGVAKLDPTMRPELTSVHADVALPEYLQREQGLSKDVRGGSLTLVKGSRVAFRATASRELAKASVNGKETQPEGATILSAGAPVDGVSRLEFDWADTLGLSGKEPFSLSINGRDDEQPSVACDGLPRQKVVLDSEQLTFRVHAQDDFGVKVVGIEWQGLDTTNIKNPAQGEQVLSAGGSDRELLEITGTFSAKSLGIEPQPIQVRLFVEDYFPGRPRTYSPNYVLYVLNPEQHAIWLTDQLSKWHRQSLEVRDKELQLHETNKQLRGLTADELDTPETRRRIDSQAAAERANGRKLSGLVNSGEELVRQAARNPEFGVGHLEKWAEMLQILKDISDNRMPSVADLMKQAADAPTQANSSKGGGQPQKPEEKPRTAGQQRAGGGGSSDDKPKEEGSKKPPVPTISDVESTQRDLSKEPKSEGGGAKSGSPRLGLPSTTLLGGVKPGEACPAGDKIDEALAQQQDLLAEFDKIADELNRVLANLEGSTLVKRLKAASRTQNGIAGRLTDVLPSKFDIVGAANSTPPDTAKPSAKPTPVVNSDPFALDDPPPAKTVKPEAAPAVKPDAKPEAKPEAKVEEKVAASKPAPPTAGPVATPAKPSATAVGQAKPAAVKLTGELSQQEMKSSQDVSTIMDDMHAYFERRRMVTFKAVLDEMRKSDVVGGLRQLSDDIAKERGLSIAQCEFWSDTLDRWAEDLVDPASGGS